MEDCALGDIAAASGELECGHHDVGRHAPGDRPAHDHAGAQANHGCQGEPALAGAQVVVRCLRRPERRRGRTPRSAPQPFPRVQALLHPVVQQEGCRPRRAVSTPPGCRHCLGWSPPFAQTERPYAPHLQLAECRQWNLRDCPPRRAGPTRLPFVIGENHCQGLANCIDIFRLAVTRHGYPSGTRCE